MMKINHWIMCFILTVSILSFSNCLSVSRREQDALEAFQTANSLMDEGKLEEAADAYRNVLKYRPKTTSALFNLSLTLAEMEDYSESIRILESLERQDPKNIRILQAKGWVLHKAGKYEDSISSYTAVLELFSDDKTAIKGLAANEMKLDMLDNAIARIEKLLIVDETIENHEMLARLYKRNNSLQAVLHEYRWIESNGKLDIATRLDAGKISEKLALYDEAMEYYSTVGKSNTEYSMEAWFLLAHLQLVQFQDYASGIASLEQALNTGFQDDKAIYDLLLEIPPELHPTIENLLVEQEVDMQEKSEQTTNHSLENPETKTEEQPSIPQKVEEIQKNNINI